MDVTKNDDFQESDDDESQLSAEPLSAYSMDPDNASVYRGVVLIAVVSEFKKNDGTIDQDRELKEGGQMIEICDIFGSHGYYCVPVFNPNSQEFFKVLREVVSMDFSQLICFIRSHGSLQKIWDRDKKDIMLTDVYKAADTKQMANKPKCFFISSCRKDRTNQGAVEPPGAHFVIGHACLPNQVSRANSGGSRYFETIIKIFRESMSKPVRNKKYGYTRDVTYMMAKVNRDVHKGTMARLEHLRKTKGDKYVEDLNYVPQIPIYKTTCQKQVIFH